jgi:NAD(P)-dependent dehydrogenase (short-subunit alcohol dehydrogenase family)
MFDFTGKGIIVTGGAKGIGRAICQGFAGAGGQVLCVDVDAAAGQTLITEQPGVTFLAADVSAAAGCREAVAAFGRLDILCNNVGIMPTAAYVPAHELPEDMWDRILNTNLKSAYLMTHYAIPHLRAAGGGVIISTASVQGFQSAHGVSAYAASKGGIISLTRQLALDYAADNIRVLAVAPGTIDTPLVTESIAPGADAAAIYADMARRHPLGRIGQPSEIASVVMFLASDGASFMTGETVAVDGGMLAKGAWA